MKPLQLLSSNGIIELLKRPKPCGKSVALTNHCGGCYSGIKQRLVESQAYTSQFGSAVADMMVMRFQQADV